MKKITLLILLLSITSFAQDETYNIVNLKMNNNNSHFGLMLTQTDHVYFSAPVLDHRNLKRKDQNKHLILSLFEGKKDKTGQIVNIKKFNARNSDYNTSSAVVSPNGKYIYITTNYNKKGNTYKKNGKSFNLFIERGEYIEGKGWTNFEKLPFCNPNYSYGHPAISPDGSTLYFVSNIPSAKGATDIFKVYIEDENTYSKPENLGSFVNSVRKEMFPFVDKDGVLYFSSDRANGSGGLDVYKCELDRFDDYKLAKALPSPINSKYDDFCYVVDQDKNEGYFSSKRPSGKGDDDIYYFTILEKDDKENLLASSNKP